jgi:hypothetical protein
LVLPQNIDILPFVCLKHAHHWSEIILAAMRPNQSINRTSNWLRPLAAGYVKR